MIPNNCTNIWPHQTNIEIQCKSYQDRLARNIRYHEELKKEINVEKDRIIKHHLQDDKEEINKISLIMAKAGVLEVTIKQMRESKVVSRYVPKALCREFFK